LERCVPETHRFETFAASARRAQSLTSLNHGPFLHTFVADLQVRCRPEPDSLKRRLCRKKTASSERTISIRFSKSVLSWKRRKETNLLGHLTQGGLSGGDSFPMSPSGSRRSVQISHADLPVIGVTSKNLYRVAFQCSDIPIHNCAYVIADRIQLTDLRD